MADPAPAIDIRNVTFSYNGTPALENVNLSVAERDFVSVVGPNGGGKTTLLKLILGMLSPNRGTVQVFGGPPVRARSRIGYVPQYAACDTAFPIRVSDVVLTGRLGARRWWGPYRGGDRAAARRALNEVGLERLHARPFAALSGGERQRVLVARALAGDPELLLLDEPTASVDVKAGEEFYDLLQALNERLTVVLATHDLGLVSTYVRTVVCVKQQVRVHPTSELTGEMIREVFGSGVRAVRHDHRCAEGGHEWPAS